jgi:glycosyltransferase involved in cell wall biosynthesis
MQRLGVPLNSTVLCYTGNVTTANAGEVRSLYLAIGLLNRMGIPAVLVRAGTDYCDFLEGARSLIMANVIECGFVGRAAVAKLMAMADVLVQPGRPDPFNDYRFPSKLPEFFAMGKPVVLPATNIGLALKHMEQALVLPCVDAVAIVESVRLLRGNAGLRARLSAAGLQFATDRLRWEVSAAKLKAFYEETLTRPISVLATAADLTTSKYLSA